MERPIILAVDDMPEILMGLAAILGDYDVRTTKIAASAFTLLRTTKVSLILLDIEMPRMSGFDFLNYLKQQPEYADIPVIFITSNADVETITKALKAGAKGYIVKPFTADLVREKVDSVIKAAP
jgi:CheY-like chemotaxis protein